MRILYFISVYIHILSAMMWMGGILFMVFVVVPVMRTGSVPGNSAEWIHRLGIQFRKVGWVSLVLLVITGICNLGFHGYHWMDLWTGRLWQGSFGHTLAVKLSCVLLILILSGLHDFYIGPKATMLWQNSADANEVRKWRRMAAWIGRLNLVLGLIVVWAAITLVRGSVF